MAPKRKREDLPDLPPCDFTLKYGGKSREVHRYILYTKSGYWRRLLASDWHETRTNTMELEGDDTAALDRALDIMYGAPNPPATDGSTAPDFRSELQLFTVGDKYDVPSAREAALQVLRECNRALPLRKLKENGLLLATRAAYELPDGARADICSRLVKILRRHMPSLLLDKDVEELLRILPNLATDLLLSIHEPHEDAPTQDPMRHFIGRGMCGDAVRGNELFELSRTYGMRTSCNHCKDTHLKGRFRVAAYYVDDREVEDASNRAVY